VLTEQKTSSRKKIVKGEWGRRIKTGMRMGFAMGLI
jgi:hypothetical protein